MKYPNNLDFATLYSQTGSMWTEADSIAGREKPSYRVPTPTFSETRLEVDGVQIEQDIVQNAIWPELTRDVVRRAMTAHRHKINARLIQRMATAPAQSTPFTLTLGGDIDGDQTSTAVMSKGLARPENPRLVAPLGNPIVVFLPRLAEALDRGSNEVFAVAERF